MPLDRTRRIGRLFGLILLGPLFCLTSTTLAAEPTVTTTNNRTDPHSHGNPDQVRVQALQLSLNVDFARKTLRGTVTLSVRRQPGSPPDAPLIVDAKGLRISAVDWSEAERGRRPQQELKYTEGPEDPILGRAVSITLPPGQNELDVSIHYTTVPEAGALQWLDPAQTAGGKAPFLFTQSEAIQARTWIPTQDSPGVRAPYSAEILVPAGLKAVMAADPPVCMETKGKILESPRATRPGEPAPPPHLRPGGTVFFFKMDQPIPAYLIALAVGDLKFQPLGQRTGVWAEPSVLAKAAHEFADTEAMVEATEARFGPYRWGRYDLLVLPPSFPFGGMENPKLTFATPTILAGDRSLVALVAHELAHSWSGNLVTNATWNDFWLNEGFTVYLERRIVEAVYGVSRAQMEAVLGIGELRADLARLDAQDQRLLLDLKGRDPDDGMNQVAYEKGALFLARLEEVFGRTDFDVFLRGYFDSHAFQSITTEDFKAYLQANLLAKHPELAQQVDVDAWIHQPGLADKFTEPKSDRLDAVDREAKGWASGQMAATDLKTTDWTPQEWLQFLRQLPDPLAASKMADLDAAFKLTKSPNAEIAGQWLMMAAKNGYHAADPAIAEFLTTVGRRKFILPIYRALIQTPAGTEQARGIYAKARPGYHPIAIESVDKLLGR